MREMNDRERYDGVARALHWSTVGALILQFAVAWTMPDIHRGVAPVGLIAWHLSIGTAILLLVVARLIWRLTHRPPPAPTSLSLALQWVSRLTHAGLYALLIALPVLGWANASARGYAVMLFGIFPLPPLSASGSPLGMALGDVHQTAAIALLVVVGLHVLGAVYHAVVVRDRTLQRMV
uniref:cytochrome b n=1 Tax=uncultured Sphingomonas sp. TaxID=158754 RepID=UPI0035CB4F3E